jgi:signal transduction histidine kinase
VNLRGNLFIKVFIGFWLVTLAVLGSWMLSDNYFQSRLDVEHLAPGPEQQPPGPPHRLVLRMVYGLQHSSREELPDLLRRAKQQHNIDVYLLLRDGTEFFQRQVPQRVEEIAQELQGSRRRTARGGAPGELLLAHAIYRPEEGPIRAVFQFRQSERRVLAYIARNHWLRLGLAVFVSGLLCYLLSRLVTGRLQELRLASRRLAEGELGTRLLVRERGGDETDELARDFNAMAGQLQQRIQAQRQLLADVSHELRSPLARLRVALALAQEDKSSSLGYLHRIEQEAERLEELIEQLLSSQADRAELNDHIDLVSLLKQLSADARFEFDNRDKGVQLSCQVDEALVATTGDLLHKSFENILRNALLHTADTTDVKVTLRRDGPDFISTISDCGPGVPESELQRIFDEFYRVDSARTRELGGYGLGLAIARRSIEQHGGKLSAENTGNGLMITVLLPASTSAVP